MGMLLLAHYQTMIKLVQRKMKHDPKQCHDCNTNFFVFCIFLYILSHRTQQTGDVPKVLSVRTLQKTVLHHAALFHPLVCLRGKPQVSIPRTVNTFSVLVQLFSSLHNGSHRKLGKIMTQKWSRTSSSLATLKVRKFRFVQKTFISEPIPICFLNKWNKIKHVSLIWY